MATCKDCLCYKLCVAVDRAYDNEKATIMEKFCPYFKDKSQFVKIVRCKDCIYHNVPPCPMRLSLNWTNDNDYCSYGERRSENEG